MLSREDNELLTGVGPGSLIGELLRQYWQPILLSEELKQPDCPPLRVRILGEDLVAFRDTAGQVGLLGDHCPHRRASLFFGRNEEHGLRCVYHGWKFDIAGQCVDMPNEPATSAFKRTIRQVAYPCRERNGMIWAYMGPRLDPPELPSLEWNLVPERHCYVDKALQECNWMQALEGGIDTSHGGFLHFGLLPGQNDRPEAYKVPRDRTPRIEVLEMDYGLLIGARRNYDNENFSYNITQMLMPYYSLLPGGLVFRDVLAGHAWVPMDDEHTMSWVISYHPDRELTEDELKKFRTFPYSRIHVGTNALLPPTNEPMGSWRPSANRSNDYLINRDAQRTKYFTGIGTAEQGNTRLQDAAIQESMGPISDRTGEHLGSADLAIISARRLMLRTAWALRNEGLIPPGVDNHEAYRVRTHGLIVSKKAPETWVEASEEARHPV